jgi:hypothetical protein
LHAMDEAGLKGQSFGDIRKSFKEWGLSVQSNDLIKRMEKMIPEWDGQERAATHLQRLFECNESGLTNEFSLYFWLSLYCRVMHPGCMAPMALSLFGAQNAGKSYFSKLICRTLLGDKEAEPVQLDLGGDPLSFLRSITGTSLIANIGEMTGFKTADINRIKSFMTVTSDNLHFKYEGNFSQPRQWITILDGNKYEGLQRDDTGNRRFFPLFLGQTEDVDGQPAWKMDFKVNFDGFEDDLWQIMAEMRAWLENNGGLKGYQKYVDSVSVKVAAYNRTERDQGRGTALNPVLSRHLMPAIRDCSKRAITERKDKQRRGVVIRCTDLDQVYRRRSIEAVNWEHARPIISAIKGEEKRLPGNVAGYFFPEYESVDAFNEYIDSIGSDEFVYDKVEQKTAKDDKHNPETGGF